jgi:WD40-like Beta Propeller Repeat
MSKLAMKVGVPVVIATVAVVVLISRGAADSVLSFDWKTSERLLLAAEDVKRADTFSITVSPRGTHVAYVIKERQGEKDQYHLRLDGRDVGVYNYVWEIMFSPDGKRSAFFVSRLGSLADFWIIDGKEAPESSAIGETAVFSKDGSTFGYRTHGQKKWSVTINGVEGKRYDAIWGVGRDFSSPLVLSENGKHYVYVADEEDHKTLLVYDGKEFPIKWNVQELASSLSPDGTRWAYVNAERPAENQLEYQVLVDGHPVGKRYPQIPNRAVFSPDGKRVAFGANLTSALEQLRGKPGQTGVIVVDGKELASKYQFVFTIIFSPDSKRLAYEAKREEGKFIVFLDGQESKEYKVVYPSSLVFSPDSRRLAYSVTTGAGDYVVVDGAEQGPYNRIVTPPAFSPDSRHVVYLAAFEKEQFAVIDGVVRSKYEETYVPDSGIDPLRRAEKLRFKFEAPQFLTRDSFGYVAKRGGAYYWIEESRVRRLTPTKTKSK